MKQSESCSYKGECLKCLEQDLTFHRLCKKQHCNRCREECRRNYNIAKSKEYYYKNRKKLLEYRKEYVRNRKDEINKKQKEDYRIHREKRLEYKKIKQKDPKEKARRAAYSRDYYKKRIAVDINYKLTKNLRNRLKEAVKAGSKSGSAVRDLGCSIEEFKSYLSNLFTDGMSWDNWGQWHIDHIIPLSSVDLTKEENVKKVCHYTNMQPLWAEDNIKKGCKI